MNNLMFQVIIIFSGETLEKVFDWRGKYMSKMSIFNTFSWDMKTFPNTGGIHRFERKFNKHSGER